MDFGIRFSYFSDDGSLLLKTLTTMTKLVPPRSVEYRALKRWVKWLLEFAQDTDPPRIASESTRSEIERFMNRVAYSAEPNSNRLPISDDEILKLRNTANQDLHEAATSYCELPGRELADLSFVVARGALLIAGSDSVKRFRISCALFISGPAGRLIERCKRKGCSLLFVRSRRSEYCGKVCARLAEAERARLKRSRMSREERAAKRHQYYRNQVAAKRGKAVAAKVRARGPHGPMGK
jgi:hypothetical protein